MSLQYKDNYTEKQFIRHDFPKRPYNNVKVVDLLVHTNPTRKNNLVSIRKCYDLKQLTQLYVYFLDSVFFILYSVKSAENANQKGVE